MSTIKWVNINERQQTESGIKEQTVVRCIFENGSVRCEGAEKKISALASVVQSPHGRFLSPENGEEFIEALPFVYRNAYFFASDVKVGDQITDPPLTA